MPAYPVGVGRLKVWYKHGVVIRVGAGPSFWGQDTRDSAPLASRLAWAHSVGFAGIEVTAEDLRSPRDLQPHLLQYDLRLVGGHWATRLLERSVDHEIRELEPSLNLLIGLGADVLMVTEVVGGVHRDPTCPPERRPGLFPALRDRLADHLGQLAAYVHERGVKLAYQPRIGTVIQTEGEIVGLLERTAPSLGLVLDTGHLTYAGVSAVHLVDSFGMRVQHVCLKDVRPGVLEVAGLKHSSFRQALQDGVFTVPGEGMVDFDLVVEALQEVDYEGWFVVDTEGAPPEKDQAQAVCQWVQALANGED